MSLDERLSGLQKQMGKDPNADTAAEILRLKMRLGQLTAKQVRACASLGSEACLKIFPNEKPQTVYQVLYFEEDREFSKRLALWVAEKSIVVIEKVYHNHKVFKVAQKVLLEVKNDIDHFDFDLIIILQDFYSSMGSSGFSDPGHWEARDAVAAVVEGIRTQFMGTPGLIRSQALQTLRLAADSLKVEQKELMIEFILFES